MSRLDEMKTAIEWTCMLLCMTEKAAVIRLGNKEIEFSSDDGGTWFYPLPLVQYGKPTQARIVEKDRLVLFKENKELRTMTEWLRLIKGMPYTQARDALLSGRVWINYEKGKKKTVWYHAGTSETQKHSKPEEIRIDETPTTAKNRKEFRWSAAEWVAWKYGLGKFEADKLIKDRLVLFNDGAATILAEQGREYTEPVQIIILRPESKTAFKWVVELKGLPPGEVADLFENHKIRFSNGVEEHEPVVSALYPRPVNIIIIGTTEPSKQAEVWVIEGGFAKSWAESTTLLRDSKIEFEYDGNSYNVFPHPGSYYRRPNAIWLKE